MSRDFFNRKAPTWDEKAAEQDTRRLEAMVYRLDIKNGATVLDIGTGTGVFIPFLLKIIGVKGKLVCLDYAAEMLKIASSKGFQGNISFLCADVEDSRLPARSFDAAVCYSAFPHFQNKPWALQEIHRLLKKRGKLFICHTSSRQSINEIHRNIPELCGHLFPENDEMRRLLSAAGFADINIHDGKTDYLLSAAKTI